MKRILAVIFSMIFIIMAFPAGVNAEEYLAAPTVQYKIVNHDKVSLKWNKIDGAESYYIYMRNDKTGKYIKKYEVTSNAVTLKKLSPDTEYSYAVVAIKDGVKSKSSNKVTFTTPSEWYYFANKDNRRHIKLPDADIYRQHYDGTGKEQFDMTAINNELKKELEKEDDFSFDDGFIQEGGNVYFTADNMEGYLCRMKNDGSCLEICDIISLADDYGYQGYHVFISGNCYRVMNENASYMSSAGAYDYDDINELMNNYKEEPEKVWFRDSLTSYIFITTDYEKIDWGFSKEICSLSSPVADDKYIYFLAEPLYNLTDETSTIIYRADPGSPETEEIGRIDYDPSFIYSDPNNGSIELVGFGDDRLYYYVYGRESDSDKFGSTFYSISVKDKNAVPQKLFSTYNLPYGGFEYSNGYIYCVEYDRSRSMDYPNNLIYYRLKYDGTGLTKSDKPFEWKY